MKFFVLKFLAISFFPAFFYGDYVFSQTKYPEPYRKDYIDRCTNNRGTIIKKTCECIVEKSEVSFSLEQFKEFNELIEQDKPSPKLIEIINICSQRSVNSL